MSEKKIICLTRNHPPIGQPDPDVMEALTDISLKASRGEISGIAFAWVEKQGDCVHQVCSGSADSSTLVAAVSALSYNINKRWAEK